jgi:hypothetical protein
MQPKASHPSNILLIPTLDIEIVWQTHLLRPEMYQADCLRLFRRVIDHSLLISEIEKFLKDPAFQDTCQLYEQRFGEQYCPLPSFADPETTTSNFHQYLLDSNSDNCRNGSYWNETYFEFSSESPKNYENPFSFTESDLIMDGKWLDFCKQFMTDAMKKAPVPDYYRYNSTSKAIYLGYDPIERLKKPYERFLYMAAKYPMKDGNSFIHPTYAVKSSTLEKYLLYLPVFL